MKQRLVVNKRITHQRKYPAILLLTCLLVPPLVHLFHFNSPQTNSFYPNTSPYHETASKQNPSQIQSTYQSTQPHRNLFEDYNTTDKAKPELETQKTQLTIPIPLGSNLDHPPIQILNDGDFVIQGWPGSGTAQDPYRIENLNINGSGTLSDCIEIRNTQVHFIIANCNLFDAYPMSGILLFNTVNATLRNNIYQNTLTGIAMAGACWTSVQNNTFIDNVYSMQLYDGAQNNMIRLNTFYDYYCCASLYSCHNNTIANNTFLNADYPIRLYVSRHNLLSNNTFDIDCFMGIELWYSNNNTISYNDCHSHYGISLADSASNLIQRNTLSSQYFCIDINSDSHYNKITNNTIQSVSGLIQVPMDKIIVANNSLINCGIEFQALLPYINQSNFEGNTINGRPVIFRVNQTNASIPPNIGQLFLFNCGNTVIDNLDMTAYATGILICFSTNITICDSSILLHDDESLGTKLELCESCTIVDNLYRSSYISGQVGTGLHLQSCTFCIITGNFFVDCINGITTDWSSYIVISKNEFRDNRRGIDARYHETIRILNNLFLNNHYGIYCYDGRAYDIEDNICSHGYTGIRLSRNEDGFALNNTCEFNDVGISLFWERSCIITENICSNNTEDGIRGRELFLVKFSYNVCSHNLIGISLNYIADGSECTVSYNQLIDNGHGISLTMVLTLIISYNNCSRNISSGINLHSGGGSYITYNYCSHNYGRGIQAQMEASTAIVSNFLTNNDYGLFLYNSSMGNQILSNTLVGNRIGNAWDDGERNGFERNFWSDYTGFDMNGDGYGDTPYYVPGGAGSQDPLPRGVYLSGIFIFEILLVVIFIPIIILSIVGWRIYSTRH